MPNNPHREACRRHHRVIGHYVAVKAWILGLDCIVLSRVELERFLGLQRFKATRVRWLKEDLKPWFPRQVAYYKTRSPSSIHSLYLSRVEIESHLAKGTMTNKRRISRMAADAPSTGLFSENLKPSEIPDEKQMVSELAVIAAGLDSPKELILGTKRPSKASR